MNTDTETPSTAEPVWGAPTEGPAHWSRNKTLAAVGIAIVLAAGGGAVIYAADSGRSEHGGFGGPGGGPGGFGGPGDGGPGGPGGFGAGRPGGAGGPATADALHGEFVVSDGHGGFTTELTQTGKITEISDTAVTARSEDGFTKTYLITADTERGRAPMRSGDTATIRAATTDGNTTAIAITPGQ